MSKRYIFPQQCGDRKKAKLDVTVSDHNFPLSQNFGPGKDGDQLNDWGDDNDDEILLLASQACEDAFNEHNVSDLPNYSMCMLPTTTSTQLYEPVPSTSTSTFQFKKPTSSPVNVVTTKLKDKCERISSPLPGMSKVCTTNKINISGDIIVNNNTNKQDSNDIYTQLLKLQEENSKLKVENGKLLEKCVTKEGEASILRTQLKASQVSVDHARLEKVKVQERMQMEWSSKWTAVTNQMHDLRTQLDFKNLEIISMKEKCKVLESNKVKLTQITLAGHDITMSQRNNGYGAHDSTPYVKKHKTSSSAVQTEDTSHLLQINVPMRDGVSTLPQILPLVITPLDKQWSLLDYNEKLRQSADTARCRVYSTFHRLPSTPKVCKEKRKIVNLNSVHETLSNMTACREWTGEEFLNVYKSIKECLLDVQCELATVSQRVTTAFQKEMDEKYIDITSKLLTINKIDLLSGCALYKEEQAMLARRMTAVLVYILEDSRCEHIVHSLLREHSKEETDVVNIISRICTLLDNTACALLYSGLLLSITLLLKRIITLISNQKPLIEIFKTIILSRPQPFVTCEILHLFSEILSVKSVKEVCSKGVNLKMDYDQGVLLYKKDSCVLQVMLKHIEGVLKCVQNDGNVEHAVYNTRNLILLYSSINSKADIQNEKLSCECQLVLMQVMVYGLNICANMLNAEPWKGTAPQSVTQTDILSLCRSGTQVLYRCALRDVEFASRLGHNEGHLLEYCDILRGFDHTEVYSSMLSEIASVFQSSCEESPATYHQKAWLDSFHKFSLTD
ncbi:uncharacterized protein LOC112048476 [Bicyclus anynana]|uniref:Uncharacterized protein LOC112048476 n=1 Tax=Bicyclus anynana TaxID=110368 RepID=A0A6J1N9M9_BICAN|nr:uncharacterized protein LOC112048476 [Bicyclus anynana]